MEYLSVGQIVKTVGLKGEVKVYPSTHFRDSRFSKGSHFFILDNNNSIVRELTVKIHHKNGECDNLIFNEISSIEEAETIVHQYLNIEKDDSFLDQGQYFYSDLQKMSVYFDNGTLIGKVTKIEEYNSYATLRVKTDKKDVLIPFVKAFIVSVDKENQKIIVKFIEGLLWK